MGSTWVHESRNHRLALGATVTELQRWVDDPTALRVTGAEGLSGVTVPGSDAAVDAPSGAPDADEISTGQTDPEAAAVVTAAHAATPTVRPESLGLSTARLARVTELMQRQIDAGTFSGSVTLIARNGRVAMLTAQGVMDLESKTPMRTDAMFRIMSMTKPIVAVSILMLAEEGKLRLTDPIGNFIPELKALKVTVPNTEARSSGRPRSSTISVPFPSSSPVIFSRPLAPPQLASTCRDVSAGGGFVANRGATRTSVMSSAPVAVGTRSVPSSTT